MKFSKKLLRFFSGNYTILLIFLFLLFITRPYQYGETYTEIWKTFLTLTLIIAIFNCAHQKIMKIIIFILAFPVLFLSWFNLVFPSGEHYIITAAFTTLYMIICTASIIYDVLLRAKVTLETLRGVICAYFLVSFIFAYIYVFLEFMSPGTFLIDSKVIPIFSHPHYFSDMLYFSFITLLTIGYGDIIAIKEFGRTAVVIEGIIGQFYVAILVARIVSVYSFVSDSHILEVMKKMKKKEET